MTNLQPGQMLGPYRIISQIGEGGMATVYKAYQASIDRNVAVKVLPGHLSGNKEFAGRFQQEARIIGNLEHPHILPVFDSGESDGVSYLVMRYLDAGTLKEKMESGPMRLEDIDKVFQQFAEALHYAHERGVIHRDLKPSNALIDSQGNLFLTDFGIAKLLEGASHFTRTDMVMGTPAYMSPEQAQAQKVDRRADIYSLGIILYEMITGRVPFMADTPLAILLKHVTDNLPLPSLVMPGVSPQIEQVLLKALAKNPEDRFATALEFAAAWKRARTSSESSQVTPAGYDRTMRYSEMYDKVVAPGSSEDSALQALQKEEERLAKQKAEEERAAQAKAEAERLAVQKAEEERLAKQKAEEARAAQAKAEAERLAVQKAEEERLAKQKAEEERAAKLKAEKEQANKEEAKRIAKLIAEQKAASVEPEGKPVTAVPAKKRPASRGIMFGVGAVAVLAVIGIAVVGIVFSKFLNGNEDSSASTPTAQAVVLAPATEAVATSTPRNTATPKPITPTTVVSKFFTEEFDKDPGSDWTLDVIGPNASSFKDEVKLSFNGGKMHVEIPKTDLYVYYTYDAFEYDRVRLELSVENLGVNSQNVSLVCRLNDNGWYEWSVGNDGLWYLYAYSEGFNVISEGGSNLIKQGKVVNEYAMVCDGNKIFMYINGQELNQSPVTETTYNFASGTVSFNISSIKAVPVIVDVDWFKVLEP